VERANNERQEGYDNRSASDVARAAALVEVAVNGTTVEARKVAMDQLLRLADFADTINLEREANGEAKRLAGVLKTNAYVAVMELGEFRHPDYKSMANGWYWRIEAVEGHSQWNGPFKDSDAAYTEAHAQWPEVK